MLMLTRKNNEKVIVYNTKTKDKVEITLIGSGSMQVGVDAPRHLLVDREEIFNKRVI